MTNTCIKENTQQKKTNCFLECNKLKKQYKITTLKSNKWISKNTYRCGLWEEKYFMKQIEKFENKSRCNWSLCFARFYKLRKKTRSSIHKPIGSFNWPEWEETIYNYYDSRNENEIYIKQVSVISFISFITRQLLLPNLFSQS